MAREKEVNVIVDAQNKTKGTFLDVRRGLRDMDREARRSTSNFSSNFSRLDRVVGSFSYKLQFMDKVAKRVFQGTAAATAIYAAATLRDFAQLEDGISKVNTLYDQTKQSQAKMVQDSIRMHKLIPTDYQKITQGIYDTISAGASPEYATMISRKFGQASVAGMTEMPIVTKAAMGTMNAFGKEVTDLNHILDIQFLTVKRGITEYGQLASSLDTGILKAAESAGMSMEGLYGGIAQITKNGIPAAQATTQLGSMLARVTDPKVIKNMKEFGVELQDEYNNTRPLVEILKDLNEQFEKRKMTGAEQAGFLKEILGRQEAVRGFQTLISQAKEYEKIVKEMENADGTMQEAFEDRLDNINTQVKLMWNNFKDYGLEQINALKPFMDALMEPTLKRQKLEFQKMDLEDSLMFEKDPKIRKMTRLEIEDIQMQIDNIDMTPIEKFREGLKEGVEQLEKINPPLAKFVDFIGDLALNFSEKESWQTGAKVGGGILAGTFISKKLGDAYLWFRKFGKGSTVSSPGSALTQTMQTMNVNANIVNVYGRSINNVGGGRPGAGVGGSPGGGITGSGGLAGDLAKTYVGYQVGKKAIEYAGTKLLTQTGAGVGKKLLIDTAVKQTAKQAVITAAEKAAAQTLVEVGSVSLPSFSALAPVAGVGMGGKIDISDSDRKQIAYEYMKKNDNLMKKLLDIPIQKENIEKQVNLQNTIKVEPPKLDVKVFVDGKQIPAKFDYDSIRKAVSRDFLVQSRRYGKD